jgi:hypothetical protein
MGIGSSSSSNPESIAMALAKAKEVAASAPVVVFRCVRLPSLPLSRSRIDRSCHGQTVPTSTWKISL